VGDLAKWEGRFERENAGEEVLGLGEVGAPSGA